MQADARAALAAVLLFALLAPMPGRCGVAPSDAQIHAALEKTQADPNLGVNREVRRLKWVDDQSDPKPHRNTSTLKWLASLVHWIAESARILVWVIVGLGLAALALYLTKYLGELGPRPGTAARFTPTHVRDLDIRPESLPADIGAAALALWRQAQPRAALSLLYRGMLSRLAHEHAVPVKDSSTEGDCLALARAHLPAERASYVARLVRVWQQAVYGGQEPSTAAVTELCAEFAAALSAPAPALQARPA